MNGNIDRPLGIAFDANGKLYVSNNGTSANNVAVFTPTMHLVPPSPVNQDATPQNFTSPSVIAIDGQSLFLGLGPVNSPDSVREYSVNQFLLPNLHPMNVFAASGPTGLAFDNVKIGDNRLLLVTDYYSNQVAPFLLNQFGAFPPGSALTPPITGSTSGPGPPPTGFLISRKESRLTP